LWYPIANLIFTRARTRRWRWWSGKRSGDCSGTCTGAPVTAHGLPTAAEMVTVKPWTPETACCPPEEPRYTLRRVWLDKEEEEGYYYGFSNEACGRSATSPILGLCSKPLTGALSSGQSQVCDAVLEEMKGTERPGSAGAGLSLCAGAATHQREAAGRARGYLLAYPVANPEAFGICPGSESCWMGSWGGPAWLPCASHCHNFLQT